MGCGERRIRIRRLTDVANRFIPMYIGTPFDRFGKNEISFGYKSDSRLFFKPSKNDKKKPSILKMKGFWDVGRGGFESVD